MKLFKSNKVGLICLPICISGFVHELSLNVTVLCCSAGFVTRIKFKWNIVVKFLVKSEKNSNRNEEAISASEDTHFTKNKKGRMSKSSVIQCGLLSSTSEA
jgi:hypothetical protein